MTVKLWKGTWDTNTAYKLDDLVDRSGKFYACLRNHNSGSTFTSAEWAVYIPNITEIQASTAKPHIKTDNEFTTQFPTIISAIATAVNAGLYSITVSLNESDYNTVKLNLELKGYTISTNRNGFGTISTTLKPCTISWIKYSVPGMITSVGDLAQVA
jgi:hypothetical protein